MVVSLNHVAGYGFRIIQSLRNLKDDSTALLTRRLSHFRMIEMIKPNFMASIFNEIWCQTSYSLANQGPGASSLTILCTWFAINGNVVLLLSKWYQSDNHNVCVAQMCHCVTCKYSNLGGRNSITECYYFHQMSIVSDKSLVVRTSGTSGATVRVNLYTWKHWGELTSSLVSFNSLIPVPWWNDALARLRLASFGWYLHDYPTNDKNWMVIADGNCWELFKTFK